MKRATIGRWGIATLLFAGALASPARAIYLDEDQTISLRARVYSQASIRTNDSQGDTFPEVKAGQLVAHRNFYNPELEAKLTSYTRWMKGSFLNFLAPDDFSFRMAAWGFYDGIYDWGSRQIWDTAKLVNRDYPDVTKQEGAFYLEGEHFEPQLKGGPKKSIEEIFRHDTVQRPRDIYGHRQRVNELYLNYSKGPVFVRIGRQAISWGESDTISLLDQNNPFDLTLGAPGIFQDLDEARIPLWTIRTSVTMFDTLGPLSSGLVEAYWVPGDIDTNVGILPVLTASPYSVPGKDPQSLVRLAGQGLVTAQFVLLDHIPQENFENSRYGFRAQTVVNGKYTVQAWMYTHFPNAPVPLSQGIVQTSKGQLFVTETVHKLTTAYGLATTFFFEPLDGIIRAEGEYFDHEPSFVPELNLGVNQDTAASTAGAINVLKNCTGGKCRVPTARYLRWELGYDRFFFVRPLNPSNSFLIVAAMVGSWNVDEGNGFIQNADGTLTRINYRMNGQRKPGAQGTSPDDYVDQNEVEMFGQVHMQTDYMHGRLSPGVTVIGNVRGTYALLPAVTYRFFDWLLFDLSYVHIGGAFQQAGFFRDRDQVSARVTYQLN